MTTSLSILGDSQEEELDPHHLPAASILHQIFMQGDVAHARHSPTCPEPQVLAQAPAVLES